MVPNESQWLYLLFKHLIHHLRWWIWGPGGPQSPKIDQKITLLNHLWGLLQPDRVMFMGQDESLFCLSWSYEHFAHPISYAWKYFLSSVFLPFFNFKALHSPKYAKSTYSMYQFFDPTHFIFKMHHFRRS